MKISSLSSIFMFFSLFAFSGCGSSQYVNNSYNFNQLQEPKIALLPALHDENPTVVDSLFEATFSELIAEYNTTPPSEIRNTAQSSEDYKKLLTKLNSSNPDNQNLYTFLTEQELTKLQELISNSRFILIPAQFSLKDVSGSAVGKTTFQLYDISNGTLIFSDKASFNVMPDGTLRRGGLLSAMNVGNDIDPATSTAARYCIELLATHGRQSFKNNFSSKTK